MPDEKDIQDFDSEIVSQMLQDFLEEALDLLAQLNLNLIQLKEKPDDQGRIEQIFRLVHTMKGSAAFAGLNEMSEIGLGMEKVFGDIRKGIRKVTPPLIQVMFNGLDALASLREKAVAKDRSAQDISGILEQFDHIPKETPVQVESGSFESEGDTEASGSEELLSIYKEGYDQLSALKHLVYSSIHLTNEESLAALFSKQIDERMSPERNAVWLVKNSGQVVEIARDGDFLAEDQRRVLDIESSEVLTRVIADQLVVWPSSFPGVKEIFPEFTEPLIVPINAQPRACGFLVLDPEGSAEVEVYQFVGQFAAMMLNISRLYQQIDEQRKELDEMTAILFRQNTQLSSLYHVELDLMKINDPVNLCRILAEAFVHDLEARDAAVFLIDEFSQKLTGVWSSGGLKEIDSMSFPVDSMEPIQKALESGRIISQIDFPEEFRLGPNLLSNWIVMCLKGRKRIHGVVVAEIDEDDVTDSMTILANYAGILLDNLILQMKKVAH